MFQRFGNRFAVFMPWSKGLGTLGIKIGDRYADLSLRKNWGTGFSSIQLFTSVRVPVFSFESYRRSWYTLTWHGWKLMRREDFWGEWGSNKRRPPLYEMPEEGVAARAHDLAKYFKPYQIIDWYGERLEVISYPCPETYSVIVMMREPNDPTTLREVVLENYIPEKGPVRV